MSLIHWAVSILHCFIFFLVIHLSNLMYCIWCIHCYLYIIVFTQFLYCFSYNLSIFTVFPLQQYLLNFPIVRPVKNDQSREQKKKISYILKNTLFQILNQTTFIVFLNLHLNPLRHSLEILKMFEFADLFITLTTFFGDGDLLSLCLIYSGPTFLPKASKALSSLNAE